LGQGLAEDGHKNAAVMRMIVIFSNDVGKILAEREIIQRRGRNSNFPLELRK